MNSEHEFDEPIPHRAVVVEERAPRPLGMPSLSWGAVFAGLFVILAVGWLLELLGVAIGVSIADASDSLTMGGTLAPAVSIWLLVCWLASFFLGGLVTARLAGRIDDTSGMLHGLTLWAVSTVVMVTLTYYSMSALVNTGTQALGAAAGGVGKTLSATVSGTRDLAAGAMAVTDRITQNYGDRIQDALYASSAEIIASSSSQVSAEEVRNAISSLDERTLRRMVNDLVDDDSDGAAELLANNTALSEEDSQAIVESTYQMLEERFGNPNNDQALATDLKARLIENVDSFLASLESEGGPRISEQDIQQALNKLDSAAVQDIAARFSEGDVVGAKRSLTRHTNLSQAQVNELVDGAAEVINQEVTEYQKEFDEAVEATSTYTSQILWVVFTGMAAAMAAALVGGFLGADSSRRQYSPGDRRLRAN